MKRISLIIGLIFSLSVYAQNELEAIIQLRKTDPTTSIIEIDQLLFANETQDTLKAYLLREKGYAYQRLNDLDNSTIFLKKASHSFNAKTQTKQLINVEIQLSNNLAQLNKQHDAIKYASLALQRAEERNDKTLILKANENLSYVYYMLGKLDQAIDYLQVSEKFHLKNNNLQELSAIYNNLAILFRNKGDFQKSVDYNEKSLALNQQLNDLPSVAKSYNNLGIVYHQLNNIQKATSFFEKAIALNDSLLISNSNPLISLANLQQQQTDYVGEEISLRKALTLEEETGRLDVQKSIYKSLLSNSLEQNNNQKAKFYQSNIERIDSKDERRQKEENLQLIETHKQLLDNELKWRAQEQQTITYQWIAFSIFLLALSFGVYFYQRQAKKNALRQKQRAILENKVLRSQMNPHFIFNALTAIQNTVMNNKPLDAASYIAKFAKLIRQNFDFVQQEWISLDEDMDALQNYMQTQQFRFNNSFEFDISIQTNEAASQLKIPPMLLQPFVENAIEHGIKNIEHAGEIYISVEQTTENRLYFTIKDNGKGYAPQPDKKLHAIQIVKDRLRIHNPTDAASFKIQSLGENQGTSVEFSLTLKL